MVKPVDKLEKTSKKTSAKLGKNPVMEYLAEGGAIFEALHEVVDVDVELRVEPQQPLGQVLLRSRGTAPFA